MLQPIQEIFQPEQYPDLLVGLDRADDAAVYRLSASQAIVVTTDFFPPVVDDPYDFGAVAAANAMSDIYAMGAQVLFAINLVAFPANLDRAILREILRGGAEKVAEAGGVVVGGHSVEDREPKYGLAVIGTVDPTKIIRKGGAKPGDSLFLTKPLGTGVITTALKQGDASGEDVAVAVVSMKQLSRSAAAEAVAAGVSAMTDVTGFGLLGHAHEMAVQSSVDFYFQASALRWLPGALRYGEAGAYPGGAGRNREYFGPFVTFAQSIDELVEDMLWTPETSGGLLVAIPEEGKAQFTAQCRESFAVGFVAEGDGRLHVLG